MGWERIKTFDGASSGDDAAGLAVSVSRECGVVGTGGETVAFEEGMNRDHWVEGKMQKKKEEVRRRAADKMKVGIEK